MKTTLTIFSLFINVICQAQHSLEKIWESDTTLAVPESVLPYKDVLFVAQTWLALSIRRPFRR